MYAPSANVAAPIDTYGTAVGSGDQTVGHVTTVNKARMVASEMGRDVSDLARLAFEAYLDGVREARSMDLDDGAGISS